MIKLKNILAENMRRFGTKNLAEQSSTKSKNFNSGDAVKVRVIQFLRKFGATDNDLMKGLKIDQAELDRLDTISVDLKTADNKMKIIAKFPLFSAILESADLQKKADLIMLYAEMTAVTNMIRSGFNVTNSAEEVAIILYFIKTERDAQIVSNYIKNRTKQDLYTYLRSNFSLIKMTTPYVGDLSIIDSLRRLNVPIKSSDS